MSLITRCPACTTLFKVVPDQLRVSEGWVRCGQCDEVFDATAHLQGDAAAQFTARPPTPALSQTVSDQPTEDTNGVAQAPTGEGAEPAMQPSPQQENGQEQEQELASRLDWPEEPLGAHYDALMDVRPGATFEPDTALHLDLPGESPPERILDAPQTSEPNAWSDPEMEVAPQSCSSPQQPEAQAIFVEPNALPELAQVPAPTFMRTARTAQHPWMRRGLIAMALMLVSGLVAQVIWRERDRLAASVPDLRPTLSAMCTALDCQINPFKNIDTVVIDSSSFVKIRGDVYRLNVTLKNIAPIEVAAPAVELTLTDLQEQPMVRHVLSAAELGAQQGTLAAGGELTTTVPIQLKVTGITDRVSGYRLLAFYP